MTNPHPFPPLTATVLPSRYDEDWLTAFYHLTGAKQEDVSQILDVGSGRRPALPPSQRPVGCTYVGLDASSDELLRAPPHSYDDIVCDDLMVPRSDLTARFDLIVSWQVFEHLATPDVALTQLRSYLRPTGRLVALLSGRYSCFGVANRVLPSRLGRRVGAYVTSRPTDTVFNAYYVDCYYDGLARLFAGWGKLDIHAQFRGETYFRFSPFAHRAYLAYESWAHRNNVRNLATHYFVVAAP